MARSGVGHNSNSDGGVDGGDVPNNKNILCAVILPLQRPYFWPIQPRISGECRGVLENNSLFTESWPPARTSQLP